MSLLASLMAAGVTSLAQPAGYMPPDYDEASHWLCRPGREDACAVNIDATVIEADGSTTIEPHVIAEDPAIDCFYVYPTVSNDETPNSDLVANDEEMRVIEAQFARFNSVCRPFAPMYRQVTLTALRAMMAGNTDTGADGVMGYLDVAASFRHYMENDNDGRPFVLIGHSQGTRMLTQLVAREIDGTPLQDQMLSALLIGFNVTQPVDAATGGSFQSVAPCTGPEDTGCVIAYVSFRADAPPPKGSRFANSGDPDTRVVCTNPADLPGSEGNVEFDAYLNTRSAFTSSGVMGDWVEGGPEIETPFVKVPGLLSGECLDNESGQYLALTVHGDPSDPRTDTIVGDVMTPDGAILADWGLHLIDFGIVQGDLIDFVGAQAELHGAD